MSPNEQRPPTSSPVDGERVTDAWLAKTIDNLGIKGWFGELAIALRELQQFRAASSPAGPNEIEEAIKKLITNVGTIIANPPKYFGEHTDGWLDCGGQVQKEFVEFFSVWGKRGHHRAGRDEVIEECAKVAEGYADNSSRHRALMPTTLALAIRDAIRALKGQP